MATDVYFAPEYFSPYYFPPLAPVSGGVVTPSPPLPPSDGSRVIRDRDGFESIAAALRDTGEFASVELWRTPDSGVASGDQFPLALIVPREWTEEDDGDPGGPIRRVAYDLVLAVRGDDAGSRFDSLDRLTSVAQNSVACRDLGVGCVPTLTRIRRGRFDRRSRHPEQRVVLSGEFAYMIPGESCRDTSE